MNKLSKFISIVQVLLLSAFILIIAVGMTGTVYLSYDFVYTSLAWIIVIFAMTLLARCIMSIINKVSASNEEIIELVGGSVSKVPSEASDDSVEEKKVHYAKPTEDDPVLNSAYGSGISGELNEESEITDICALSDKLTESAENSGLKVKRRVFTEMLSAMASSHIIFVKGLDSESIDRLVSLFNTVFGSESVVSAVGGEAVPVFTVSYSMLKDFDDKNVIKIKRIYGNDWQSFSESYKYIISNMPTVYGFLDNASKNLRGDGKTLLNNIFLICSADEMDIYQMPKEFANASTVVEFSQGDVLAEPTPVSKSSEELNETNATKNTNVKVVNGNMFSDFVQSACSQNSISLDAWKKLDKLQALLEKSDKPLFGNIELRQIERLASVYMELGASEDEALDFVFCSKILPIISSEIMNTLGSEIVISDSIESIFGGDALPLTKNEIVKIQTSYINSQNR